LLICNSDDADAIPILKVDSNVHVNDLYVDANHNVDDKEIIYMNASVNINDHINNLKVYEKDNGNNDKVMYITD